MYSIIIAVSAQIQETVTRAGYIVGAIIAVIILGYLVYSMFRPEKF
jgi:K+-transporting ATPase KdpF subunit